MQEQYQHRHDVI